jgi:DNA repair protein RAD5
LILPSSSLPTPSQISHTIEGRILKIQKRKTAIIKEAFRGPSKGGADSESMENLKIMFGEDDDDE